MSKKKNVWLTGKERRELLSIIKTGKHKAREILSAHVLLKSSQGWPDEQISEAFDVSSKTVQRIRERYLQLGLPTALQEQKRTGQPHKLTLEQEAQLIALVCSQPPPGRCRWTVRLLTAEAQKLEIVFDLSPETLRQLLKKTRASRGKSKVGVKATRPRSF
jgi:transposase